MKEVALLIVLFVISVGVVWFWEADIPPDWEAYPAPVGLGIIRDIKEAIHGN